MKRTILIVILNTIILISAACLEQILGDLLGIDDVWNTAETTEPPPMEWNVPMGD